MKIRMTFELAESDLLAISHQVGRDKPATRGEAELWIDKTVTSTLQVIRSEYDERGAGERNK